MYQHAHSWTTCIKCNGRGKIHKRLRKKVKLRFKRELEHFLTSNSTSHAPIRPKGHLDNCPDCQGTGLTQSTIQLVAEKNKYPQLAIVGGGIGGMALAVACLHRGIPFTLYERDHAFNARSQGYGLTLQQASKAIEGLGIFDLDEGVISNRHLVHTTDGKVIAEWGIRKLGLPDSKKPPKRTNVHVGRQSLRMALLEQLGGHTQVKWGYQLQGFEQSTEKGIDLSFKVDGEIKSTKADLLVGADGIFSTVRDVLIGGKASPLRYLGCIVILGICPLAEIEDEESALLDSATVFQTANGHERMYMMPYSKNSIMWQLSFPLTEKEATLLSAQGAAALKAEACLRCRWHSPIPQVLEATQLTQITGYPVYDRALLAPEQLGEHGHVTLIGDAAHPMSPFKGQGANQALLDALSLAREITKGCMSFSHWNKVGVRAAVLTEFEKEMLQRSAKKVKDSADAARFLHSDVVLYEGDEPRGQCIQKVVIDS